MRYSNNSCLKVVYNTKGEVKLPTLTTNKIYDVVAKDYLASEPYYTIIDDFGNLTSYSQSQFTPLDELRLNKIEELLK